MALAGSAPSQADALDRGDLDSFLPFNRSHYLGKGDRKVFAHWHFFPISVDNKPAPDDYYTREWLDPAGERGRYKNVGGLMRERPLPRPVRRTADWFAADVADDLRMAEAIGIDAFQVNIRDSLTSGPFVRDLITMLDVSSAIGLRTGAFPCLDCTSALSDLPNASISGALVGLLQHKACGRDHTGRSYLSAFAAERWSAERWKIVLDDLDHRGAHAHFIPIFLDTARASPMHIAIADTVSAWAPSDLNALDGVVDYGKRLKAEGKPWCHPVRPQDFRPKDGWYAEAANSRLFRDGWEAAITTNADAVNLVSWNDYSEGSEIRPSTGIQYAFYDLAAYFVEQFKRRTAPEIARDVLYYFHRVQFSNGTLTNQKVPFIMKGTGSTADNVELVAFLTAASQLEIRSSVGHVMMNAPAGVRSMLAPLAPGPLHFEMRKLHEGEIIACWSEFPVCLSARFEDMLYRGGSSLRG